MFDGSILNYIYFFSLLLGVAYALFLLFFQGVGEALGDFHLGEGTIDLHADNSAEVTGISMLAIASFISTFGASGLISDMLFGAGAITSLIIALVGGTVFGILGQVFFMFVLSPTVSSEVIQSMLIGKTAEITVPIPVKGVGQIAFVAEGSRVTYPARAVEVEQTYTRGTPVRIERIVGGIAYVNGLD